MNSNLYYWLMEQDQPPQANQAPPQTPPPAMAQKPQQDLPPDGEVGQDQELPETPDRPEEDDEVKSFQNWKLEFFEQAIKGDANGLIDKIGEVRDTHLNAVDRKFVEDNIQILLLRQDANLDRASKEIRKLIKQELDKTNPGTTLMQHITNTLEAYPQINNILIKLCGLYALKGDLHRKLIAALVGGVQVGGAGDKEDIIYPDSEYTINISTRFYTDLGSVALGGWSVQEDDPQKYLSEPEVQRLEEGSPEERMVLRNRIAIESIADRFISRAFLIHACDPANGELLSIGWDIAECLREGYKEGKFVVRPKKGTDKNAMFTMTGELLPLNELCVFYAKQEENMEIGGTVTKQEVPFMERRDGILYLVADFPTIQDIGSNTTGFFLKETPYAGNPSDIPDFLRCHPSCLEILLRKC